MKFIKITILFSFFIYLSTYAQKVDLDRAYFPYSYTNLPSNPFPPEYKTFNVTASVGGSSSNMSGSEVEDKVSLAGFQRVDKATKADLSISIKFGDFMIDGAEVKERVEVTKNKEGKETGRKYYYRAEIIYSYGANLRLMNNVLGNELMNNPIQSTSSKKTYLSSEYESRSEAASHWNDNKETLKSKLFTEAIKSNVEYINSSLANKYGYKDTKVNYVFWFQGEKKNPEYELNNKIFQQIKIATEAIKSNQPLTPEIKDSFKPIIEYFNDVKLRFNKSDKNDKKMRYSSCYNLGFIYIMLEDYANARKEAEALIANDYDKNDSKDIIRAAENAESQLKANNTDTRHFVNKRVPAEQL